MTTVTNNVTDDQSGNCHLWGFTLLTKHLQLFYRAKHCSAVQCCAVQCSAVQCSAVQCTVVHCCAMLCSPIQVNSLPCSDRNCTALHCIVRAQWSLWNSDSMFLNGSAGGYISLGAGEGRGEGGEFVTKVVRGNQFFSALMHIVYWFGVLHFNATGIFTELALSALGRISL